MTSPRTRSTRLKPIPRRFYARSTLLVARELVGKLLVRVRNGRRLSGLIVETEAYIGSNDSACHAARGRTPRNEVMFGPPGHAYVYFVYGMHWMLNVVTEKKGFPAAVLIRAVEPVEGLVAIRKLRQGRPDHELTAGPARLCSALSIKREQDGADLVAGPTLCVETYQDVPATALGKGPRIGIEYAKPRDRRAPWRFWLRGSPYISKSPKN